MGTAIPQHHRWLNILQTLLLIAALLLLCSLAGSLLFGEQGVWIALAAGAIVLLFDRTATWRLTLHLYRAQPIYPQEAPELWRILEILASRAELPNVPTPYYVPSPLLNAFAVGNRKRSAIALSDGLLNELTLRELTGVLGHETAHIADGDLKVMGLADTVSRITALFAFTGQLYLLLSIALLLLDNVEFAINWPALLLLLFSPHLALLAQLGLSRIREYDADLKAGLLTGDPLGLALALARIERKSNVWLGIVLPGWGNPEPSWLRTHPDTAERIRRLQQMAVIQPQPVFTSPNHSQLGYIVTPLDRAPRWRIGGLWR